MIRRRCLTMVLAACGVAAGAVPLAAQPLPAAPAAARIEIAAAGTLGGTSNLGGGDAALTANTGGSAFTLFSAGADYQSPMGADLRIAYRLKPWLLAGVIGTVSRGDVRVTIASDAEGAPSQSFVGEALGQASAEARLDILATRWSAWQGRLVPYATVSGGLFRQWHDEQLLIDTGGLVQAGAGVRFRAAHRPRRLISALGAAFEIRVARVSGGFHWGREQRTVPSARVELFTGWGR